MSSYREFVAGSFRFALGNKTLVMGIVNVTPDSFSDGGEVFDPMLAVERALQQIRDGADIIDVGGESTRPGSDPLPLEEELRRVLPVIERLAMNPGICISIDTYKATVAEQALKAGASIVNDISAGGFDPEMPSVVRRAHAGVILMHIKGTPRNMQVDPQYDDVVEEVAGFLGKAVGKFLRAGVKFDHITVDPGIGFGKRLNHNLELTRNLHRLSGLATGVVYGPSRKSFIGALTDRPAKERLAGTLGAVAAGVMSGADIVRVHDVRETVDMLKVLDSVMASRTIPA